MAMLQSRDMQLLRKLRSIENAERYLIERTYQEWQTAARPARPGAQIWSAAMTGVAACVVLSISAAKFLNLMPSGSL